jgi:hypothetical protein
MWNPNELAPLDPELKALVKAKLLELNTPPVISVPTLGGEPDYIWEVGEAGVRGAHPFYKLKRFLVNAPAEWVGSIVMQNDHGRYGWVGGREEWTEHEHCIVDRMLHNLNTKLEQQAQSPFELDEDPGEDLPVHTYPETHPETGEELPVYEPHPHPMANPKTVVTDFVPGMEEAWLAGEPVPVWVAPEAELNDLTTFAVGPPYVEPTWPAGLTPNDFAHPDEPGIPLEDIQGMESQMDAFGDGKATHEDMRDHVRPLTPTYEAWLRLREVLHKLPGFAEAARDQMLRDQLPNRAERPKDPYVPPVELTQEYLQLCADSDAYANYATLAGRAGHIRRLRAELASTKAMQDQERFLRDKVEVAAEKLQQDLEHAKRTASDWKDQAGVINKRNESLAADVRMLKLELELEKERGISTTNSTQELKAQLEQSSQLLHEANLHVETADNRVRRMEEKVTELRERQQLRNAELARAQDYITELKGICAVWDDKCLGLTDQLHDANLEIEKATEQVESLRSQMMRNANDVGNMQRNITALRKAGCEKDDKYTQQTAILEEWKLRAEAIDAKLQLVLAEHGRVVDRMREALDEA